MVLDWYTVTLGALQNFWQGFLQFVPQLLGALVIFLVGWFVAVGVGKLISEVLKKLKFSHLLERAGWKETLEKAELKVDPAEFIGALCKWALVIVFLLAAVEILGLTQFAGFLADVLAYIPNAIVAVLILVVTVVISDILEKMVRTAVEGTRVGYGKLAGSIVKWSVWTFAVLAILMQLQIAPILLQTLFTGVVAFMTIAASLAFGLGGKDVAAEILQGLKDKLQRD